jgi:hypothetical protein
VAGGRHKNDDMIQALAATKVRRLTVVRELAVKLMK